MSARRVHRASRGHKEFLGKRGTQVMLVHLVLIVVVLGVVVVAQ